MFRAKVKDALVSRITLNGFKSAPYWRRGKHPAFCKHVRGVTFHITLYPTYFEVHSDSGKDGWNIRKKPYTYRNVKTVFVN